MAKFDQLHLLQYRLTGYLIDVVSMHILQEMILMPLHLKDGSVLRFMRRNACWHDLPNQNFCIDAYDPDTDSLEMVLSEVCIPFAKKRVQQYKRLQRHHRLTLPGERLYICVQVDDLKGDLFASFAVVEQNSGWKLMPCGAIRQYGSWLEQKSS